VLLVVPALPADAGVGGDPGYDNVYYVVVKVVDVTIALAMGVVGGSTGLVEVG
jgi:hypothetical protein